MTVLPTVAGPALAPEAGATRACGRVAVVIPAYNEAPTVAAIARRALACAPRVIVVDDGSQDATAERLRELSCRLPVTVLRHARNRGKAASLCTGIRYALSQGATAVITLDADGQHRPEDIPKLLAAGRENPRSLIIAARLRKRERVPGARRFANFMADFWISWAAGYPIRDSQSGFRLYPAELLRRLRVPNGPGRGFVFESEILIEAARAGCYARAVAIESLYPPQNRPSHYRPLVDTVKIVRMVGWKLLSRGMCLPGLYRSLRSATPREEIRPWSESPSDHGP